MLMRHHLIAGLPLLLLVGCASFNPSPGATDSFQQREITKTNDAVTVSMAILSPKESENVIGVNLAKKKIQPIWLEIDNRSDTSYWLMPILIDHDYYAPHEVAYKFRHRFSKKKTRIKDDFISSMQIPFVIPPNQVSSGYIFARQEAGIRYAKVFMVKSHDDPVEFSFAVPVPGVKADFEKVDFSTLYQDDEFVHVDTLGALREALAALPRSTANKKGTQEGDPLNLIVIGDMAAIVPIFSERDWDITEEIRWGSIWKTTKAFFTGSKYQFSPVSSLYVFGRRQDAAFQKIRGSIHERNHLRLWLSPIVYQEKSVFIGQISRDIGVRFTTKTIVTHKIDPDVDSARIYLAQDLLLTRSVESIGHIQGVEEALLDEPRKNLTGDPYFTDGLRLVTILSDENVQTDDVNLLEWDLVPHR